MKNVKKGDLQKYSNGKLFECYTIRVDCGQMFKKRKKLTRQKLFGQTQLDENDDSYLATTAGAFLGKL